jgi:DNA primase
MATDPVIEDIKSKLDIVDIIGSYITLKRSGTNYKGLCPFHGEKTPSFMVNRERQIYRCFGCGEAGDMFQFVMKQENVDFPNALRILADRAGVILPEKNKSGGKKSNGIEKSSLFTVNSLATKFFHQVLIEHKLGKEALDYLHKRGVTDQSIKDFVIGYAPPQNMAMQSVLQKYGMSQAMIRAAGAPERFRDRIMFPFRDVIGQVVGFSGRALHDQMPKYLNTSETELFHKNRYLYGLYEAKKNISAQEKIVLVEGQLDLIMAHQVGTNYAVATSGTALTHDHLRVMRRYSDTLTLALDGDTAGQKATERAISLALEHEFTISVVGIPTGSDPGEMIANSPEAWHNALAQPMPVIDWLLLYFFPEMHKPSSEELNRIFTTIFSYIALQKENVSQTYHLQQLAIRLGIKDERVINNAFREWLDKQKSPATKTDKENEHSTTDMGDDLKRERNIIGLLFLHPEFLVYEPLYLEDKDFTNASYAKLYRLIKNWYNETTTKTPDDLIRHVTASLPKTAEQSLQKLLFDVQTSSDALGDDQLLQEYTYLIQSIRQRLRDERIQSFATLIAQAEANKDRSRMLELMQQMQDTLKQKEFHAKENP